MARDERIKFRALTVRELEQQVKFIAEQEPNAPVQIGICVCGVRVLTFERTPTVSCAKCEAEVSVKPITVQV